MSEKNKLTPNPEWDGAEYCFLEPNFDEIKVGPPPQLDITVEDIKKKYWNGDSK